MTLRLSGTTGEQLGTPTFTPANPLLVSTQSVNSYAQALLQNTSNGTSASTDFIVTNDAGSDSTGYGDFGINSSLYSGSGPFSTASGVYAYAQTGSMAVGTVSAQPLVFGTSNTEQMRVNAGAPILCLSGGNTSATGTGIAFPATQSASSDANTLDDYEEGTFTPTLVGGTTNPTYTNAGADGSYTKVGRFVSVNCHIQANSISGGSGAIGVGNLPFTSGVGTWAAVTMGYANFSGASLPTQSMLIYSSNKVYFWTTTTQIQLGSYTSVDVYLTINYIV